jgi:DNA-binding LytR/AlgR family response regulator
VNCIIVEDEPLAVERLREYIQRVSFLNLLETFNNAVGVVEFLSRTEVDLMFLDVEMEGLTGIQLLETLKRRPEVVLTTAYEAYALKGFDLSVADYLLKPFSFQRFLEAVSKVSQKVNHPSAVPPYVFIKNEYRLEKIFTNEILFIEGMGDYRQIHTLTKKIMTLQTFTELEGILAGHGFCRVHKSFIVSLSKIEFIERDRIRIGKELIPISETYKDNFYRMVS